MICTNFKVVIVSILNVGMDKSELWPEKTSNDSHAILNLPIPSSFSISSISPPTAFPHEKGPLLEFILPKMPPLCRMLCSFCGTLLLPSPVLSSFEGFHSSCIYLTLCLFPSVLSWDTSWVLYTLTDLRFNLWLRQALILLFWGWDKQRGHNLYRLTW